MSEKFIVILPHNIQKLGQGFSSYDSTRRLIYESDSITEVHIKYPDAIIIQRIKNNSEFTIAMMN